MQGKDNVAGKRVSEVPENCYGWHLNTHFCVWGFFVGFILTSASFGALFYLLPHQEKEHTITDFPYGILLCQKKNLRSGENLPKVCQSVILLNREQGLL